MPKAVGWLGKWKFESKCCGKLFSTWEEAAKHEARRTRKGLALADDGIMEGTLCPSS